MKLQITPDIDSFYAEAIMYPEIGFGNSWGRVPLLKIKTKIYHIGTDDGVEDGEFSKVKIGEMVLYKVNKWDDIQLVCDAISSSMDEVGVAIHRVMGPDNDDDEFEDMDAVFAGDPFVLEHFGLEPEFQKKRLGHLALHLGLQASGCEGHPVFIRPANSEESKFYENFDFLKKFYLDAEDRSYVIDSTEVIIYPVYNDGNSVEKKRNERLGN